MLLFVTVRGLCLDKTLDLNFVGGELGSVTRNPRVAVASNQANR